MKMDSSPAQTETEPGRSSSFLKTVLDSLRDHIVVIDQQGRVLAVNRPAPPENEMRNSECFPSGSNYLEACKTAARNGRPEAEAALRGIQAVLAGEDPHFELEYDCSSPERKRWRSMSVTPLGWPEGGAVITHADITERKLAEIESHRFRSELAHRDRLDIQSYLTGIIAHEISQPLAAILSHAQAALRFLRAEEPCLDEVREALEDIVDSDKRAAEVISRLLAMSRREKEKRVALDLNELIDQVLSLIRSKLMVRKVVVRRHFSPALNTLQGDSIQIQQVILNLLLNALEALKTEPPARRVVEVSTATVGDGAVMARFHDTGPGLPLEITKRIFDPFFTTTATGTGLGLAISRSIIEAHGGLIWAENHPDGGALFSFQLPASKPRAQSEK